MNEFQIARCKNLIMYDASSRNRIAGEKRASPRYNNSKCNNGHSQRRTVAADIYESETDSVFRPKRDGSNSSSRVSQSRHAKIHAVSLHRRPICIRLSVRVAGDKYPFATFYTGISIKFVRDKSCYMASAGRT